MDRRIQKTRRVESMVFQEVAAERDAAARLVDSLAKAVEEQVGEGPLAQLCRYRAALIRRGLHRGQ